MTSVTYPLYVFGTEDGYVTAADDAVIICTQRWIAERYFVEGKLSAAVVTIENRLDLRDFLGELPPNIGRVAIDPQFDGKQSVARFQLMAAFRECVGLN
jgi:hypothetical protein